jgi:YD repeat-containing protein
MTKVVYWHNYGDDIVKEFDYDSFGNLIYQKDGNGHITTIEYGSNPIFPVSFTNALGHTTVLQYNMLIGRLIKITDPNGAATLFEYDGLGRLEKVVNPGDTLDSPTIRYSYFTTGKAPEYVQISVKEQDNKYYDMWSYFDGLRRVIKTESTSDLPSQKIITEMYYDNYGDVSKIIAPRKGNEPALEMVNLYDSFGRLIQVTNPDGSSRQVEYSQLTTVIFDENRHKTQADKDIYGNIIKVTEFNGNEIYETCYEYDALDQLIKIIPNQYYDQSNISFLVENGDVAAGSLNNIQFVNTGLSSLGTASPIDTTYKVENTTFTYDSLGR